MTVPPVPTLIDEVRDLAVGLLPDLGSGRLVVSLGVLVVVVLVRLERAGDLLGEAVGDPVVGLGRLGRDRGRGDHDLGAVGAQQRDLLLAHLVGHREDAPVALDRGGDRQADAGVARGRFDDRPAGLELAGSLGRLDHPEADPVLHAAAGIEHLELPDELAPDSPARSGSAGAGECRRSRRGGSRRSSSAAIVVVNRNRRNHRGA